MSTTIEPVKRIRFRFKPGTIVCDQYLPQERPCFHVGRIGIIGCVLSLAMAVFAAVGIRWLAGLLFQNVVVLLNPLLYLTLIPIVLIFLLVYKLWGLYPAIGLGTGGGITAPDHLDQHCFHCLYRIYLLGRGPRKFTPAW